MRALFISNGDPFGVGGGAFGSRAFLNAFSEICHGDIDIIVSAECKPNDGKINIKNEYRVKARSGFRKYMSVFTGELHRYTDFTKEYIEKNPNLYDICVLNNSLLCYTIVPILKRYGIKIVVIHHNFEREYFRDNITNPIKRMLLVPQYIKSEKCGYLNSNLNLFHTLDDIKSCEKYYGKTASINKTLGVFEFQRKENVTINNCTVSGEKLIYIITGSMNNPQGVDSIKYFMLELYPLLSVDSKVIIAGQSPSQELIELCSKYENVQLIPSPRDMEEILQKGNIYICPTRVGGGLKVRIMDGLKSGMPAIVHKCSSRGYDMFFDSPYFKVFEDKGTFRETNQEIEQNFKVKSLSKELIIEKYNDYFSFDAGKNRITNFLKEAQLLKDE